MNFSQLSPKGKSKVIAIHAIPSVLGAGMGIAYSDESSPSIGALMGGVLGAGLGHAGYRKIKSSILDDFKQIIKINKEKEEMLHKYDQLLSFSKGRVDTFKNEMKDAFNVAASADTSHIDDFSNQLSTMKTKLDKDKNLANRLEKDFVIVPSLKTNPPSYPSSLSEISYIRYNTPYKKVFEDYAKSQGTTFNENLLELNPAKIKQWLTGRKKDDSLEKLIQDVQEYRKKFNLEKVSSVDANEDLHSDIKRLIIPQTAAIVGNTALGVSLMFDVNKDKNLVSTEELEKFISFVRNKEKLTTSHKVSTDPLKSYYDPTSDHVNVGKNLAITAHELGHAKNDANRISKYGPKFGKALGFSMYVEPRMLPGPLQKVPLLGLAALPFMSSKFMGMLKGENPNTLRYSIGDTLEDHPEIPMVAAVSPKLYEEGTASLKGLRNLKAYLGNAEYLKQAPASRAMLGKAFGTYATAAALPVIMAAYMGKMKRDTKLEKISAFTEHGKRFQEVMAISNAIIADKVREINKKDPEMALLSGTQMIPLNAQLSANMYARRSNLEGISNLKALVPFYGGSRGNKDLQLILKKYKIDLRKEI